MRPMTQPNDVEAIAEGIASSACADLIGSHVAELISAVGSFQDQCEWMADERDLHNLATLLDALEEAYSTLAAIRRDITPVIAELMGRQQVQVGDYKLERFGGKVRRRWQSGSIFNELIARSNVSPEGEVLDDAAARERLIEAVRACVPLTGSLAWRTRALQSWGVDPDEYAESSPASFRVEVHHVTDEGTAA